MIESNASDDQVMLVLLASTDKRKKQMVYSHLILCVCGCPIKEIQLATQKKKRNVLPRVDIKIRQVNIFSHRYIPASSNRSLDILLCQTTGHKLRMKGFKFPECFQELSE